ncbi:MAG TPA: cupin domain-containing protein, partial [Phnomibacter sp.]|nr:cupin domain-containing protein [Phnomibacter sp.]
MTKGNRLAPLLLGISLSTLAQTAPKRVIYNDPAKYRQLTAVHAGAGKMGFTQLIGRTELSTNFLYLHAGVIEPKSGIGHHFHHSIEEMYVLLDGEAEFTINGRTSLIKAPALVPCKMGDAHGIFNPTAKPVRWLNYAVSKTKGRSDNFDLGDTREGAVLDAIPVFVSARLERDKLRANNPQIQKKGTLGRRLFGPEVFSTNWNHVDHWVLPADSATQQQIKNIEEVYFVVKGSGTATINNTAHVIKSNDAFYAKQGETLALTNKGPEELEILAIGIAVQKETTAMQPPVTAPAQPKAMVLQMDFIVAKENADAFEKMYQTIYVPALKVQPGYLGSKLLRTFTEEYTKKITGELTEYNYQLQL